jgi:hypothetical protein
MEKTMLARLKPHDPKKGLLLKQYTYQGIRFLAGRGWYRVNRKVAAYLKNVHSIPGDEDTPLAFEVCTPDEARAMDENDRKAARQVLPAEEALDVSHVGDEQPRAKSRPSPDRDDAPRRQPRNVDRLPKDAQTDALAEDDAKDEAPPRRPSRRRAGVVSRRPRVAVEDFDESDDDEEPEGDEFEDEVPRRRARRGRAGAVPRRRLRAGNVDEFDDEELDDEELDDEVGELDEDELDEEFADEEFADEEFDDDTEAAPPSPRRRRSLPPRSRAPQARRVQRYAVEHDVLDEDDSPIRRVRGARQREALEALRNREAHRTRPRRMLEDQYDEMPARRLPEDAAGSELDDVPTQKLRRSRSQGRHQDELHIRHARQMVAKLEEIDALDDAMSYGDAEDSLPNNAKRNRHDSHGDAEDSLPTTTRSKHVSQRDAEDSLPGRATRYGDAEDSLPGKGARNRHSGHGDAEDSLSTRDRHSYGDAEDSLPHRRMQHQDAPSSRHTADAQDDLDAVDQEPDHRHVEEPARSDARSQRAQQPPSSAAHDELDALDDALDDRLEKASEDQRPGSAQPHARGQRAQQPPSSAAHDELDALDDALDDRLEKASEDQRPGSAQPQHGQQHTGNSPQGHPDGAHNATSGAVSHDERQPWPDDDPFVNRDTRHQAPAPGHEPVAAATSPRQGRRIYVPGQSTRADASEAQNQPQPGRQRRTV